jgi:hypothetical protein
MLQGVKMKKRILILMVILILPAVYANYAVSTPTKVEVAQGGETTFDFQIQGHYSENDLICEVNLDQDDFKIKLEEDIVVSKGDRELVEGIIKAPRHMPLGDYQYNFCVECLPQEKESGVSTNIRFCDIPLKIVVVKPAKGGMRLIELIGVSVIIILCLAVLFFRLFGKKKVKNKKKLKVGGKVKKKARRNNKNA